jgi:hypothetical protein
MDPRVKSTPEVQRIFTLTVQMENAAASAAKARKQARDFIAELKTRPQSARLDALIGKLEQLAPEPVAAPAEGRGPAATVEAQAPTLTDIGGRLVGSVMPMQAAEMPPATAELDACAKQHAAFAALMSKWAALKAEVTKE